MGGLLLCVSECVLEVELELQTADQKRLPGRQDLWHAARSDQVRSCQSWTLSHRHWGTSSHVLVLVELLYRAPFRAATVSYDHYFRFFFYIMIALVYDHVYSAVFKDNEGCFAFFSTCMCFWWRFVACHWSTNRPRTGRMEWSEFLAFTALYIYIYSPLT